MWKELTENPLVLEILLRMVVLRETTSCMIQEECLQKLTMQNFFYAVMPAFPVKYKPLPVSTVTTYVSWVFTVAVLTSACLLMWSQSWCSCNKSVVHGLVYVFIHKVYAASVWLFVVVVWIWYTRASLGFWSVYRSGYRRWHVASNW